MKKFKEFKQIIITAIIMCISTVLLVACGKPKDEIYDEAKSLLESGKYDEAEEQLKEIADYKDVSDILEQMKWESKALNCVEDIRSSLKNVDSLQIKQIVFFSGETQSALTQSKQKYADKLSEILCSEGEPAIVFNIFGQNGFGGNSQDYIIYIYKNGEYICLGSCKSLEKSKCRDDDEKQTCDIINDCKTYLTQVGSVDMNRIETIVKNRSYSTVKIINN